MHVELGTALASIHERNETLQGILAKLKINWKTTKHRTGEFVVVLRRRPQFDAPNMKGLYDTVYGTGLAVEYNHLEKPNPDIVCQLIDMVLIAYEVLDPEPIAQ